MTLSEQDVARLKAAAEQATPMARLKPMPVVCRCGCGNLVKRFRGKYASRKCHQKMRSADDRRRAGEKGGAATARNFEKRLVEKLKNLEPTEAILRAYYLGRRAAYRRKYRHAKGEIAA